MSLVHLTRSDVTRVAEAAAELTAAFPPSPNGIIFGGVDTFDKTQRYTASSQRQRLVTEINSLSIEARHELVALMWFGRERGKGDLADYISHARQTTSGHDANYIAEKAPALPVYLEQGLAALDGDV